MQCLTCTLDLIKKLFFIYKLGIISTSPVIINFNNILTFNTLNIHHTPTTILTSFYHLHVKYII